MGKHRNDEQYDKGESCERDSGLAPYRAATLSAKLTTSSDNVTNKTDRHYRTDGTTSDMLAALTCGKCLHGGGTNRLR